MRQAIADADVVSWSIGGNDMRLARQAFKQGTCGGAQNQDCLQATRDQVTTEWDAIIAEILALRGDREGILRTMDVYNPYVSEDRADGSFAVFKLYLDDLNQHFRSSGGPSGIRVAAVYAAFNGPDGEDDADQYITFDGLHPTDAGHERIAGLLRAFGYQPLHP